MPKNSSKIREVPVGDLVPYENNPRFNDGAVDAVAKSIREFGFRNPIIVDRDNVVIAGHTRLKAALKLGLEKVPVIVADDLTPEQVKAYRIADNSTGMLADWDYDLLRQELEGLPFDMAAFGLEIADQDLDIDIGTELENDLGTEPEEPVDPFTRKGMIYRLGDHVLMCGDSTDPEDMARLMRIAGGGGARTS